MGGSGQDRGAVTQPGIGAIVASVRVASKPAFAVLVGAVAFLAQDLFQRLTGVQLTTDEAVGITTVLSWLAYWLIPSSLQDAAPAALLPPSSPPPGVPTT